MVSGQQYTAPIAFQGGVIVGSSQASCHDASECLLGFLSQIDAVEDICQHKVAVIAHQRIGVEDDRADATNDHQIQRE